MKYVYPKLGFLVKLIKTAVMFSYITHELDITNGLNTGRGKHLVSIISDALCSLYFNNTNLEGL